MPSDIFAKSVVGGPLRQGEILSDAIQYVFDPNTKQVTGKRHRYSIIASQDCDLERDWQDQAAGAESSINSILIFLARDASERQAIVGSSTLWNPAKKNSSERFHVLESCPPEEDLTGLGVPALIIDFRRFFSVTPEQFYHQLQAGLTLRRAVLRPPYREHLQTRAIGYLGRVALDKAHDVQ